MKQPRRVRNDAHINPAQNTGRGLERRLLLAVATSISPIMLILVLLLLFGNYSTLLIITLIPLAFLCVFAGVWYMHHSMQKQFFGMANVIECLRNGDFTVRATVQDKDSAWGEVNQELNRLSKNMHDQRIVAVESEIILDKLIEEFDVPLLVTDRAGALRHLNQAAVALFAKDKRDLIGLSIEQLNLTHFLYAENGAVLSHQFPARDGKWEVRRNIIRRHGSRFNLLLLNDLSRALREEQRLAWLQLIRVLGHELNNSLASITSVAETMTNHQSVNNEPILRRGLNVIVERGHGLQRFTEAYTSLAKLPQPEKQLVNLDSILGRVITLINCDISVEGDTQVTLNADPDQIEQVLINLIKNGLESGAETPTVKVTINKGAKSTIIDIIDNGQGIANPDNLFVPFYTTKNNGTGVGLFLSRQIVEAHNGRLTLDNLPNHQGCVARIWYPNHETK